MDYKLFLISRLELLERLNSNAAGSVWAEKGIIAQGLVPDRSVGFSTQKKKILSLATSYCTVELVCFCYAVAGKHFSQALCSIGLKATGGFSTQHGSGCQIHGTGP